MEMVYFKRDINMKKVVKKKKKIIEEIEKKSRLIRKREHKN